MTNETQQTLTILRLDRLRSSVYGNPRYRVTFTDGSAANTKPNAGFCYGITNREYHTGPVVVTFAPSGNIIGIEVPPKEEATS